MQMQGWEDRFQLKLFVVADRGIPKNKKPFSVMSAKYISINNAKTSQTDFS
jgi:hypothetical protein